MAKDNEKYDGSEPLKNSRQEAFVQEYLKNTSGTQAAIKAGYSPKSANVQASRLLTYDNIKARLKYLSKRVAEQSIRDAASVLEDLQIVKARCLQEVMHVDKDGKFGKFRFDANSALRALELEGRYYGMWKDKQEHDGEININVTLDD